MNNAKTSALCTAVLLLVFCLVNRFAPVRGWVVAGALLAVLIVGGIAANVAWSRAGGAVYPPRSFTRNTAFPRSCAWGWTAEHTKKEPARDQRPQAGFCFFQRGCAVAIISFAPEGVQSVTSPEKSSRRAASSGARVRHSSPTQTLTVPAPQ